MKCRKCGFNTKNLSFHRDKYDCAYDDKNERDREHLHYHCSSCGYDWCADTEEQRIGKEVDSIRRGKEA